MGSRVTIPERRSGALRRLATVLPGFIFVTFAGAGCPPHQATLAITANGAVVLRTACTLSCDRSEDGGIESSCACALSNRPPPDLQFHSVQAKLFLVTPADQSIRDASKCMTLLPC